MLKLKLNIKSAYDSLRDSEASTGILLIYYKNNVAFSETIKLYGECFIEYGQYLIQK